MAAAPWQLAVLWSQSWNPDYRQSYPDQASCNDAMPALKDQLWAEAKRDHNEKKLKGALLTCVKFDALASR